MGPCRVFLGCLLALLAGCTSYESAYERGVYDYEPTYCYQSLAAVTCHREPQPRDARRLVNYYGPAPSKYDPPEAAEPADPQAPPERSRFVLDPEPDPAGEGIPGYLVEDDRDDWKRYLPILTVVFGAAQLAAAFLF